jgi:hypothetical protein
MNSQKVVSKSGQKESSKEGISGKEGKERTEEKGGGLEGEDDIK